VATPNAVIYLDVDDEITSAAARIRRVDAQRVGVVVPPGSRIATSRINFRLLAREALAQGRRLAVVAPDGASRALAASAGLPVFGSVGEFEAASEPRTPPPHVASGDAAEDGGRASPAAAVAAGGILVAPAAEAAPAAAAAERRADEGTIIIPPVPGEGAVAADTRVIGRPAAERGAAERGASGRRRRLGLLPILAALVLLLLLAGGVAGYVLLPSASVTITPRFEDVGPISFVVRADPSVTAVDPTSGVIPAQRVAFDLSASDTFHATGQRVQQVAATGNVRWTNCDPTSSYRIPAGAVVRTRAGIRFATTEAVFLPVAGIKGSPPNVTLDCQGNTSGVKAVDEGPEANVPAGSITVPPANYNSNVIKVTNPAATSGGTRQTFPQVTKKDVDAAQAALRQALAAQLDQKLAEPGAVPAGATVFPDTKTVAPGTPSVDPPTLVNQETPTFDLGLRATGTVIAVDQTPLAQVAAQRLATSVRADHRLVEPSVDVKTGSPTVSGEVISFPVEASATQVASLDPAALRAAIRGRAVDEARGILDRYGAVQISTWPGWVSSIPTVDQRLDLTVAVPSASPERASPSTSPSAVAASPTPAVSPTRAPSGS
jgi:hypothetical protein